jgi:hypothetical protein
MRRPILISLLLAVLLALVLSVPTLACVTNNPPTVYIDPWAYYHYVLEGQSLTFEENSYDSDGYISSYYWSCSYSYSSPSYSYYDTYSPTFRNGPSKQSILLKATDNDGDYAYSSRTVYIMDSFQCTCTTNEVVLNGDAVEVDIPSISDSWKGILRYEITGGSEHIQI